MMFENLRLPPVSRTEVYQMGNRSAYGEPNRRPPCLVRGGSVGVLLGRALVVHMPLRLCPMDGRGMLGFRPTFSHSMS